MLDKTTVEITKEKLVVWLETMPPEETYNYFDHKECLIAQFLKSEGAPQPFVVPDKFTLDGYYDWNAKQYIGVYHQLPSELDDVSRRVPRTFGAALKRVKLALASEVELV